MDRELCGRQYALTGRLLFLREQMQMSNVIGSGSTGGDPGASANDASRPSVWVLRGRHSVSTFDAPTNSARIEGASDEMRAGSVGIKCD
jgi:hypothetical protein